MSSPLLIASGNAGKISEFTALLEPLGIETVGLNGPLPKCNVDPYKPPPETGTTFEENSYIKAKAAAQHFGCVALADDSGLAVQALAGRPGVYSARYGGPHLNDAGRVSHLLDELINKKDRRAAFHAVLCLCTPQGDHWFFNGQVVGEIAEVPSGGGGFGYDPVFYYEPAGKTFAEMDKQAKNSISHRAKAAAKLIEFLSNPANLRLAGLG